MPYIYKITNDINDKVYIGKTEFSIEKRFKEHCRDAFKERNEKRPLYNAMQKYGIEHFCIEEIEKTDKPEEREQYWIQYYNSFKYGYNATLGGDGKSYIDKEQVIKLYTQLHNCIDVAKQLDISADSVRNILKQYNIQIIDSTTVIKNKAGKKVSMIDKNTKNTLKTFISYGEAAKFLIENNYTSSNNIYGISAHIGKVCNGRRKTAYGFIWKKL